MVTTKDTVYLQPCYYSFYIRESQNGLGWKAPQGSWSSNPPKPQAGPPTSTFNTRLPRGTSNLALNVSRDVASTASLGSLFQHLTTLRVKNFPLISNLNLPSHNFKPFPLSCYYLLFQTVDSPPVCRLLYEPEGCNEVTPQPRLLQVSSVSSISSVLSQYLTTANHEG